MFLMIDNYDSFTYNLVAYLKELEQEIMVTPNDKITREEVLTMVDKGNIQGIILSPGPKRPEDAEICRDIVACLQGKVPILGVCLGHQVIATVFGCKVRKGDHPMHGKITEISHNNRGLFQNLPNPYHVTRYHSLVVDPHIENEHINIDALGENNTIMAISHRDYPIYGVQFHPEAVLTEWGHALLQNFISLTEDWQREHGKNH